MFKLKVVSAGAIVSILSACGGGAVSNQEFVESLADRYQQIDTDFIDGQEELLLVELPRLPSATYTGTIGAFGGIGDPAIDTEEVRVAFIGELELNADLINDTVEGTAGNFVDIENAAEYDPTEDTDPIVGESVSGSLAIVGELTTEETARFDVSATGELEAPNGAFLNFDGVGGLVSVYGANAEALEILGGAYVTFDGEAGFISYSGLSQK